MATTSQATMNIARPQKPPQSSVLPFGVNLVWYWKKLTIIIMRVEKTRMETVMTFRFSVPWLEERAVSLLPEPCSSPWNSSFLKAKSVCLDPRDIALILLFYCIHIPLRAGRPAISFHEC